MRMLNQLVMDENVQPAATTFYTPASLNETLGRYDQVGIQAIVDNVQTNGLITAWIEHSADGRNWAAKNTTAEILNQATNNAQTKSYFGSDTGGSPSLGFVRIAVSLTTTTSAHVKIWVTGRDFGR